MMRDADNQKLKCKVMPKHDQQGAAPKDGSMIPDGYDTVDRAQPGRERYKPRPYTPGVGFYGDYD